MIHQIYITSTSDSFLPKYFEMTSKTIADKMPGYQHKIYFNDELRNFIHESYGNEMLMAYDRLIPFAYKADLARYLLLYHFGGWYFDISIRMINGVLVNDDIDFVTFVDFPQYTGVSYGCNNAIIYAKRKSIILEDLINEVYKNIRIGFYGRNTLCITGPVILGKSVSKFSDNMNVVVGSFVELTPGLINKNRGFVFNDGLLFALHKDGNNGGDLTKFGAQGTNNYVKLYGEKNVFDESIVLNSKIFPNEFIE